MTNQVHCNTYFELKILLGVVCFSAGQQGFPISKLVQRVGTESLSVPTLRSENLALMKTEAFSQNVGKVFQSQSWYPRTLFSVYWIQLWQGHDYITAHPIPSTVLITRTFMPDWCAVVWVECDDVIW